MTTDMLVWIEDRQTGRRERELFGSTPFADVLPSPYYTPSPGSIYSGRAWLDTDGQHVVLAHDCAQAREVHTLPWPTWQALRDGIVDPSYACDLCGFHARTPTAFVEVAAPREDTP